MNKVELTITVLMRVMGVGGLLAIPAIFLPYSWMNSIHKFMSLGTLPDTPIVSYLARSLSAFYAAMGAITLIISLDIRRHRSFVKLWAMIVIVLAIVIMGIDIASAMPLSWMLLEGPPVLAIGVTVLWCQRRVEASDANM